jgi:hypothetical protein
MRSVCTGKSESVSIDITMLPVFEFISLSSESVNLFHNRQETNLEHTECDPVLNT